MGVTIHYRGKLRDPGLIEDLEDRLVDLTLELGGYARIWRSAATADPSRVTRGVVIDLAPGLESASFVVSPDGWLVPLHEIENAENAEVGRLAEPAWVFVKTQFGPLDSHVALVHILDDLRRRYFPDLEVLDEGEYWETRDLARLHGHRGQIARGMNALVGEIRANPLSREAAEDPEIVATRVARLAEKVHRTLARPPEHAPVVLTRDYLGDPERDGTEEEWDAWHRARERRLVQLERAVGEKRLGGMDHTRALSEAIRELVEVPTLDSSEDDDDEEDEIAHGGDDFEANPDEEAIDEMEGDDEPHPLVERATALGSRILDLAGRSQARDGDPLESAARGVCELMGGTVQATSDPTFDGYTLVQLKRALRGAAQAHGGLFASVGSGTLDLDEVTSIHTELDSIERELQTALHELRERRG